MRLCIKPIIDRCVRQWRDVLINTFHTNAYIKLIVCRDPLTPLKLQHAEQARQEAASSDNDSRGGTVHEKQAFVDDHHWWQTLASVSSAPRVATALPSPSTTPAGANAIPLPDGGMPPVEIARSSNMSSFSSVPLASLVDSKIKPIIWAGQYIELDSLLGGVIDTFLLVNFPCRYCTIGTTEDGVHSTDAGFCYAFGSIGRCRKPHCPYKHACPSCGGNHPKSQCATKQMPHAVTKPTNAG